MPRGRKPVDFSAEESALILSMYADGYSFRAIADGLAGKCSEGALRNYVKLGGLSRDKNVKGLRDGICEACSKEFVGPGQQKFCFSCIPTRNALQRYRLYGITQTQFEEKLAAQSYLCAMCELELPEDTDRIHVDHCHKQGHTRDLLCGRCNNGLAYIEDDKFFANAVRYIERHRR